MNTPMGQSTVGEMLPLLIIIGVLFLIVVFAFLMVIKTSKARKQAKLRQKQLIQDKNAILYANFPHVAGLQIPENTLCKVFSCPDSFEISANGIDFKLDKSKIHDITFKTDVEIQKQYVSSAAGAVGGAILFGSVGALIGGRVKERQSKTAHTYMIISYSKDDSVDYIAFDITNNLSKAGKFIDEFRARANVTSKSVQL